MFAWRIWNLFIDNIYVHDCVYIYMIFNTHETIDMCYMHDTYNLARLPILLKVQWEDSILLVKSLATLVTGSSNGGEEVW